MQEALRVLPGKGMAATHVPILSPSSSPFAWLLLLDSFSGRPMHNMLQ